MERAEAEVHPAAKGESVVGKVGKGNPLKKGSRDRDRERCVFCGYEVHVRGTCPARDKRCTKCGVRGHFRDVCGQQRHLGAAAASSESSSEEEEEEEPKKGMRDKRQKKKGKKKKPEGVHGVGYDDGCHPFVNNVRFDSSAGDSSEEVPM